MRLFFDFLPLILFFGTFKVAEGQRDWSSAFATEFLGPIVSGGVIGPKEAPMLLATVVVIAATLGQVLWMKLSGRKVGMMLWVTLVMVAVLGGLTLWFHNDTFIKWKPSAVYWSLGLAFWFSQAVFRRNLLRQLLGEQLRLPDTIWQRLNFAWVAFFGLMGLLNLWVAYTFDSDVWVNFKVFGATALMLVFTVAQGLYLGKYVEDEPAAEAVPGEPPRQV